MPLSLDDFAGSTIRQPGNPQSGVKSPPPSLGASQQPFQPSKIQPTTLPAGFDGSGQANPNVPVPQLDGQALSNPDAPAAAPEGNSGELTLDHFAPEAASPGVPNQMSQDQVDQQQGNLGIGFGGRTNINGTEYNPTPSGSLYNPIKIGSDAISDVDRLKMSVGNDPGRKDYAKALGNFDDAKFTNDGLVLKNSDGQWITADTAGFLSNPWKVSKQIAENNLIPTALNTAGYAVGAPFGPAGVLAGGVATGALRTSLGRYLNTYKTTPEEQAGDIALEGFMNLGMHQIAPGVRPGVSDLVEGAQGIKSALEAGGNPAASEAPLSDAQKTISNMFSRMTGGSVGPKQIDTMIEQPGAVGTAFKAMAEGARTPGDIQANAVTEQTNVVKQWLDNSVKSLSRKYGQVLGKLGTEAADKDAIIDSAQVAKDSIAQIQDQGWGHVSPQFKAGEEVGVKLDYRGQVIPDSPGAKNLIGYKFTPFSVQEMQARREAGLAVNTLPEGGDKFIQSTLDHLSSFTKLEEAGADTSVKTAHDMATGMSDIANDVLSSQNASPTLKRLATQANGAVRDNLGQEFTDKGLGESWKGLRDLYQTYGDAVSYGRKVLDSNNPNALQAYTKQIMDSSSKYTGTKGLADVLKDLNGGSAESFDRLRVLEAVKEMSPNAPKLGLLKAMAAGGTAGGVLANQTVGHSVMATGIGMATGAAASVASNPRNVANAAILYGKSAPILYGFNTLNFLQSLGKNQMRQLINSPTLLAPVLNAPGTATQMEQDGTKQLLHQNGVINNGQQ